MAKQLINIGSVVDDFTGDYLRKGGQKINDNFNDIYDELGDTDRLHRAGAWKIFVSSGPGDILNAKIGEAWHIDTSAGSVIVNLPLIGTDPGRAIKLSDINGTWDAINSVTVQPDPADTINLISNQVFTLPYQVVSLMSTPTDWMYIDGIFHNKLVTAASTLIKTTIDILSDSDGDGLHVIGEHTENNLNVYLNGVLLRYDPLSLGPNGKSEYGSSLTAPDTLSPINTVPLQIQLRPGIYQAGDTLLIEIFAGDIGGVKTSYKRYSRQLVDAPTVDPQKLYIDTLVGNECQDIFLGTGGANITDLSEIRPDNFQVLYNGVLMTQEGEGGYTPAGNNQYRLYKSNPSGPYDTITITAPSAPIFGTDVVTFVIFNNVIGTLLDEMAIIQIGQDHFVDQSNVVLKNSIQYVTTTPINADGEIDTHFSNTVLYPSNYTVTVDTISKIFNLMYPIGSIYSNASNPSNPKDYLGFGTWARYGAGKTSFGYSPSDSDFDVAGDNGGSKTVTIAAANLPEMPVTPDGTILTMDDTGTVDLSECLPDPSAPIAMPASLSVAGQVVNDSSPNTPITILPPNITEYKWVRIG